MPPFLAQSAATGNGGVWLGNPQQAFTNPLTGGSALLSFICARGGCSTFLLASITDTLNNSWTNVPVDSTTGVHGLGYVLGSSPGSDTVTFVGSNFCGFTYDPCTIVAEVAGIASLGDIVTTAGTSSVMSGSITTSQGVAEFVTTSIYSAWVLTLVYFLGTSPGTGMVLAIPYAPNEYFGQDTISGWQLDSFNLHSGLYTTTVTPTPPAPVRMFVNTGPTRGGW